MKPYYEHAGITIYHGDCRGILASLDEVDAVIADPPYGETSLDWDRQVHGWMAQCESITRVIWCFGSLQYFIDMVGVGEGGHWKRAQELVWEKHNGSSFHADRFKRVHELIVQFYTGDWFSIYKNPVFTQDATARTVRRKSRPAHTGHIENSSYVSHDGGPRLMRSVLYARSCHGDAFHPTQKPTAIIKPILQYSVSQVVCDPFMGSGSTLIAAREMGLRAIGIEIEEKYCEMAARRLSQEVLQFQ